MLPKQMLLTSHLILSSWGCRLLSLPLFLSIITGSSGKECNKEWLSQKTKASPRLSDQPVRPQNSNLFTVLKFQFTHQFADASSSGRFVHSQTDSSHFHRVFICTIIHLNHVTIKSQRNHHREVNRCVGFYIAKHSGVRTSWPVQLRVFSESPCFCVGLPLTALRCQPQSCRNAARDCGGRERVFLFLFLFVLFCFFG